MKNELAEKRNQKQIAGYLDTLGDKVWAAWETTVSDEAEPLDVLKALVYLEEHFLHVECGAVVAAREAGSTWQEIANALGISKQAAWEQYNDVELSG